MKSPLAELEHAKITRAYHTADQDSVRLEFNENAELIAYNKSTINGVASLISDSSCEFPILIGEIVETISRNEKELLFRISGKHLVRIGLDERESYGPEAFQLVLPGYPLIVEQNE